MHVFLEVHSGLVIIYTLLTCCGLEQVCVSVGLGIVYRVLLILLLVFGLLDTFLHCNRILLLLSLLLTGNVHHPPPFPISKPEP